MKKNEIKVGGMYLAKVAGKLTTVRVDAIREANGYRSNPYSGVSELVDKVVYDVTNLATGRKTTFRSAAKFRREAGTASAGPKSSFVPVSTTTPGFQKIDIPDEVEQRPDPTTNSSDEVAAPNAGASVPASAVPDESYTLDEDGNEVAEEEFCTGSEPDCCEGERGCVCPGCGKMVAGEGEQRADPTCETPTATSCLPAISEPTMTKPCETTNGSVTVLSVSEPQPTKSLVSGIAGQLRQSQQTDTAPHLIVEARAGSGKTTTLVEGLKYVLGGSSTLVPSPQQKAVWDSMHLSCGVAKTICFVAFNKSIATELQARVPKGCDAMTMHSLGFKAVNKAFRKMEVSNWRVVDFIGDLLKTDVRVLRKDKPMLLKATEELVGLCKVNLTDPTVDALNDLCDYYDVDCDRFRRQVFELVPQVLELCKDPARDGRVDFDDMIWLPVVLGLPVYRYDLLLVDEAQDLNRCQQTLAKMAGKRLVLCGDPKQAIYGFAGADADSMPRMARELATRPLVPQEFVFPNGANQKYSRGCITLPLTVTRRCGKAIVREANKTVPDFHAHESNPEGSVGEACYPVRRKKDAEGGSREVAWEDSYLAQVRDGDFVLCRTNAPLVSNCFRFLKRGIKANIQGRDVGEGLKSTVKKLNAADVPDLLHKLTDWLSNEQKKEQAKRIPSESRLIALQDRHDCLICFTDGCNSVDAVVRKIESVFTDDKSVRGIRLSSIHKAKGLEARRVFFLMPEGGECPHPMAKSEWQQEQEMNLYYVAVTRAIEELIFVY